MPSQTSAEFEASDQEENRAGDEEDAVRIHRGLLGFGAQGRTTRIPRRPSHARPAGGVGSTRRPPAAVSARKYVFRKRLLVVMAVILVGSATAAFEASPSAWWICGSAIVVTLLYLAYLRRQTRIEEKVRRRRMQRMARARVGVENAHDREYDMVPSRLRRPGAVVLEIDDEDPIFEHLDYAMPMRNFGWPRDLPRAVGE